MKLDQITVEHLNAINTSETFADKPAMNRLIKKLQRTTYGPMLTEEGISGLAVGIKVGLILAESNRLEELLGIKNGKL